MTKLQEMHEATPRSGMTSVEFGLLLPILFVLIMGLIETGNICYSWLTVQRAAQEGTRFAATGQGYEEGTRMMLIEQETNRLLSALNSGTKTITIRSWPTLDTTVPGQDGNAGEPCQIVEVEALYNYKPFTPLIAQLLPNVITLLGSDRKVNEPWYPCDSP